MVRTFGDIECDGSVIGATFEAEYVRTAALSVTGEVESDLTMADTPSTGGRFMGQADATAPMFTAVGLTGTGLGMYANDVQLWEAGTVIFSARESFLQMFVPFRFEDAGTSSSPNFYANSASIDPGIHTTLDNANIGFGFTVNGNEVGYFDSTDEHFYATNNIVAGGSISGATFEADSLESVGDVTAGGQIFATLTEANNIIIGDAADVTNHAATPQITFAGQLTDGFGYNMGAFYPFVAMNSSYKMFWTST